MAQLIFAFCVLMLGAGLCFLPVRNVFRATAALGTQALAILVLVPVVLSVLMGGPAVTGELPWAYPVGELHFRLDALGAFFLSWSLPMVLLGSIYGLGYLRRHLKGPRHMGVHFALLNMVSVSFLLVYTGEHAITFLFGWEIAALAAWLLVIWNYPDKKVRFAGFNYLVSTHIGLVFLVAAVMTLYAYTQSWFLDDFGRWLRANPGFERNGIFLLLVVSFGLKSAFFPFHSWLPRAHAAAPAHISALMSGVIHKAGLYALLRFIILIGRPDEWMGWLLIVFSLASALIGGLYTVGQRDLKRLLGYSSTENVGIAGIGFGIGCLGLAWQAPLLVVVGFAGGLLHVLNHAFFKCQLFYAAGCVYQVKHVVDLDRLGGLVKAMPVTAACFLVGGVAISGLPPFNGFASEFLVYAGLFEGGQGAVTGQLAWVLVAAVLAFVGGVSALSITRAFGAGFLGNARDDSLPDAVEANRWMLWPMGIHACGTVLLGVLPMAGFAMIAATLTLILENGLSGADPDSLRDAMAAALAMLVRVGWISGSLAVVLAGVLWIALRRASARSSQSATWGCGYGQPNTRMQYSGTGFSIDFSRKFKGILLLVRRRQLPSGYFPGDSHEQVDCVDAVERRIYSVIDHGDETAGDMSRRINENDPRVAFALGLLAVLLMAALAFAADGGLS